jgi:hypothetical protein
MFHAKDVLSDQLLANANEQSWYVAILKSGIDLIEKYVKF